MSAKEFFFAVKKILYLQAFVLGLVSSIALAAFGWREARSALLGGLIAFLPNVYLAAKIGWSKAKSAQQIVRTFYTGEAIKLILTALLFYLVFQLSDILFVPLFINFIAVLMVFWFALLLNKKEI